MCPIVKAILFLAALTATHSPHHPRPHPIPVAEARTDTMPPSPMPPFTTPTTRVSWGALKVIYR